MRMHWGGGTLCKMNSQKSNEYVNESWVTLLNMYGLANKCIKTPLYGEEARRSDPPCTRRVVLR